MPVVRQLGDGGAQGQGAGNRAPRRGAQGIVYHGKRVLEQRRYTVMDREEWDVEQVAVQAGG